MASKLVFPVISDSRTLVEMAKQHLESYESEVHLGGKDANSLYARAVRLPFSLMPCVSIEAGICPIPEMQGLVCERVHNCSYLDDWMVRVLHVSEEFDDGGLAEEV